APADDRARRPRARPRAGGKRPERARLRARARPAPGAHDGGGGAEAERPHDRGLRAPTDAARPGRRPGGARGRARGAVRPAARQLPPPAAETAALATRRTARGRPRPSAASPADAGGARVELWGAGRTGVGILRHVPARPWHGRAVPALYFPQPQTWYPQRMFL